MGSEMANDQKCDLPEPIRWRPLHETSMHKDEVIVIIPEAEEVAAAEFYDEMKPVIYSMKICGLLPLRKQSPGQSSLWKSFFSKCLLVERIAVMLKRLN
jgi:hypothetical protein